MDYECATLVRPSFVIEQVEQIEIVNHEIELDVHLCLKNQVTSYLDNYPHLSLRSVSIRSGVSFTTLSRLTKLNSSTLSPHVVLNLSAYLWREYRLESLVDVVPLVISKYLMEHYGRFIFLKH